MSERDFSDGHFAIALAVCMLAGLTCVASSSVANRIASHADAVRAIATEMRLDREAMEKCAGRVVSSDERAAQGVSDAEAGR